MSFPPRLSASQDSAESLAQLSAELLTEQGACLITDFPSSPEDHFLESFSQALGIPRLEPKNLRGGMVCPVGPAHFAEREAFANSSRTFLCHTDCADFEQPPDTVIMLCEKPASSGGDSLLVRLDDVLSYLSPPQMQTLAQPVYLFRQALAPILTQVGPLIQIRYNRPWINMMPEFEIEQLSQDQISALDHLDQVIVACQTQFSLQSKDCLILDNQRLLHGRTAFDEQASRLLKRVRVMRHPNE